MRGSLVRTQQSEPLGTNDIRKFGKLMQDNTKGLKNLQYFYNENSGLKNLAKILNTHKYFLPSKIENKLISSAIFM